MSGMMQIGFKGYYTSRVCKDSRNVYQVPYNIQDSTPPRNKFHANLLNNGLQTPSDVSMEISLRDLHNAATFVVCSPKFRNSSQEVGCLESYAVYCTNC